MWVCWCDQRNTDAETTDIDLSQERIRHLHAVCTAGPGPSDASAALRSVFLLVRCRYVWWIEHEDINRVSEATCQRARECRDERFDRNLFIIFYFEKTTQHKVVLGTLDDHLLVMRGAERDARWTKKRKEKKNVAGGWGVLHLVLGPGARGTCRCVWIDVRTDEDFLFLFWFLKGGRGGGKTRVRLGRLFFTLGARESTDGHWRRRRFARGKLRRCPSPI